jgi:hypothetical protein
MLTEIETELVTETSTGTRPRRSEIRAGPLCAVRHPELLASAADKPDNSWILSGMQEEAEARQLCLGEEVETPIWPISKTFSASTSLCLREDWLNQHHFPVVLRWPTRVTGTPIKEEDRKEVVPWRCGALASSSQIQYLLNRVVKVSRRPTPI